MRTRVSGASGLPTNLVQGVAPQVLVVLLQLHPLRRVLLVLNRDKRGRPKGGAQHWHQTQPKAALGIHRRPNGQAAPRSLQQLRLMDGAAQPRMEICCPQVAFHTPSAWCSAMEWHPRPAPRCTRASPAKHRPFPGNCAVLLCGVKQSSNGEMHGWALQDAGPAGPSLQWTHNHAHALQRTRQHKFMSTMWGAMGVPTEMAPGGGPTSLAAKRPAAVGGATPGRAAVPELAAIRHTHVLRCCSLHHAACTPLQPSMGSPSSLPCR